MLTATVALCVVMTLLMGLYADLPFAVAPGMGINAIFTWGFILHAALYVVADRRRDRHPIMFVLAAIAVALLAIEHGWR